MTITNMQLELSLGNRQIHRLPSATPNSSGHRAQWWFRRMRQIVDCALDWQPAPPPRPQQTSFASMDFSAWTA